MLEQVCRGAMQEVVLAASLSTGASLLWERCRPGTSLYCIERVKYIRVVKYEGLQQV